jgi:hypothetical protein
VTHHYLEYGAHVGSAPREEDLASKELLDNPRADPVETPLRTVHSSGDPDQVR